MVATTTQHNQEARHGHLSRLIKEFIGGIRAIVGIRKGHNAGEGARGHAAQPTATPQKQGVIRLHFLAIDFNRDIAISGCIEAWFRGEHVHAVADTHQRKGRPAGSHQQPPSQ
jgi:hypothetical protein